MTYTKVSLQPGDEARYELIGLIREDWLANHPNFDTLSLDNKIWLCDWVFDVTVDGIPVRTVKDVTGVFFMPHIDTIVEKLNSK